MEQTKPDTLEFLLQLDVIGAQLPRIGKDQWQTLHLSGGDPPHQFGVSGGASWRSPDAQAPDLAFRREYAKVMRDWPKELGWPLFLPPAPGDSHLLDTVRVPVTNSQGELDEQVGCLAKLLVDSLNEKELAARAGVLEEGAKGIAKLDSFVERAHFPERQKVIRSLRDLQALRSAGSAHRKGSAYEKAAAKLASIQQTRLMWCGDF